MAKILLTSNGFYTNQIITSFLNFTDGERSHLKSVIITTASEQKERNKYAIKAKNDFHEMGFKIADFIDIEYEDPSRLTQYDVIYISGGNPYYLLFHLKKSGADRILSHLAERNIIIVGVSAGALSLGPNINVVNYFTPRMNHIGLKDFTALGLTDKLIFPHYDREDLFPDPSGKTIEDRLKAFETLNECSILRLRDDQFFTT
jgi:dipeptidase E